MARRSKSGRSAGSSRPSVLTRRIVTIRADKTFGIPETDITNPERLRRLAQEWTYLLRVRARWSSDPDLRKAIASRAVSDLESIGVTRERLQELATADRVEIELHDWDANDLQACSIYEAASEVPWEYMISAGTRSEGRYQSFLISRHFKNGLDKVSPHPPRSVLFVESAPGRFKDKYEFADEEGRIGAAVGATIRPEETKVNNKYWEILPTPQKNELQERTHDPRHVWEAIHVTGIDTHQAGWCIENFYPDIKRSKPEMFATLLDSSGRLRDGMILRQGNESELPVRYDEMAKILVGPKPPRIVTLNLYYSGARIARELVREGAHVAVGFLDEIDDELAEMFFQAFYWEWCHPSEKIFSIPDAFVSAWGKMPSAGMHGTSIVIWMGRSVFEPGSGSRKNVVRRSSSRKKRGSR
ncbi:MULTISPECIES: hypothetical protein [unclassified Bradyrhizobium]|uniref:hypothetical protein n=1 Tax=unclassified Bradyrhizobium TaxID=2631580 RepID=UPI001FFA2B39|nr:MULTISPECIES: hypothetical protein [unclassified Bradyrhizobium]MCK1298376.1 hypothetical protein [Bradyrhizobium sp. 37]MCK1771541.1 hypothetical protein [Bradyrhizobium sp. 134]